MAAKSLGLDDFTKHRSGGGFGKTLKDWKDREEKGTTPAHCIDVLLHRAAMFTVASFHQIPRVVRLEDKKTRKMEVRIWSQDLVCSSDDAAIRQLLRYLQGKTDAEPKTDCLLCLLALWAYGAVCSGELKWTDPLFKFVGDQDKERKVIHVGGLYNAFGGDKFLPKELDDLHAHGISPKDAWKESTLPRTQYVFSVLDLHDVGAGVQVAKQSSLLGDRVKKAILDRMEQEGKEEGNPLKNPYVIRWKYLPNEKEFGKKYDAIPMPKVRITSEMMEKITDTEAPDTTFLTNAYDPRAVAAELKLHQQLDVPWDKLLGGIASAEQPKAAMEKKAEREPEASLAQMVDCDDCDKPMRAIDSVCPHCGKQYEVEPEPAPAEPPRAKRSSITKASGGAKAAPEKPKVAAATVREQKAAKPAPKAPEPEPEQEDDIPF